MTASPAKKLALAGLLTAMAMICSYAEFLFPIHLGIPGVKLGLANAAVLFALLALDVRTAFLVSITRLILTALLFGNGVTLAYSAAGAMLSLGIMYLLMKTGRFSIYGISMAGGVFHNVGQVTVAVLLSSTPAIFAYLTALIPVGMLTGLLIAFLTDKILVILRKTERI